jgi:putative methionine-R-sulfoxide reductase with GAF domain
MTSFEAALQRTARLLRPHRDGLVAAWSQALIALEQGPEAELRAFCARTVDALLDRLEPGGVADLLQEETLAATQAARAGASLLPLAQAIRALDRCCLPFLLRDCPDREVLAESLLALDELADRRLETLLAAQEEESARRLIEAQEGAARAAERAREVARSNDALRRSQAESQRCAEQIELLQSVSRRLAQILEAERLMQETAELIRSRMNHSYVAVVVLDDEGVLIGRWAGRPGVGRRSAGRAQGPAGGIIGRALRKRSPQVVGDVSADPDYHPDVAGTRSELAVPLLDEGVAVGALDFQSERENAFDLHDVAVGETLAEFFVIALRNARLFADRKPAP